MSQVPAGNLVARYRAYPVSWISFADAIDHVASVEQSNRFAARYSLVNAIGRHPIRSRWVDQQDQTDIPPMGEEFWRDASVRYENGGEVLYQAFDLGIYGREELPSGGWRQEIAGSIGRPRWRGLLVNRNDLAEAFPLPEKKPQSEVIESAPTAHQEPTIKQLRGSRPKERIREAAREVYDSRPDDPPNMCEAAKLLSKQLGGGGRAQIEDVLREPEFANQRRPTGVHRSRCKASKKISGKPANH